MGRECSCLAEFGGWKGQGRLLLETSSLIFRGDRRLAVQRDAIRGAAARDGWLELSFAGGVGRFEVGTGVERWVQDILHPKSRIDKLEVKPISRVAVVQVKDQEFTAEVRARANKVETRLGTGPYDLIFYRADGPAALDRLIELRSRMGPAGAVWIITPRRTPAMNHDVLVAAAKRAGLVDTKTAAFSDTHTALKLMIPRSAR